MAEEIALSIDPPDDPPRGDLTPQERLLMEAFANAGGDTSEVNVAPMEYYGLYDPDRDRIFLNRNNRNGVGYQIPTEAGLSETDPGTLAHELIHRLQFTGDRITPGTEYARDVGRMAQALGASDNLLEEAVRAGMTLERGAEYGGQSLIDILNNVNPLERAASRRRRVLPYLRVQDAKRDSSLAAADSISMFMRPFIVQALRERTEE